jgi:hypothetical protein
MELKMKIHKDLNMYYGFNQKAHHNMLMEYIKNNSDFKKGEIDLDGISYSSYYTDFVETRVNNHEEFKKVRREYEIEVYNRSFKKSDLNKPGNVIFTNTGERYIIGDITPDGSSNDEYEALEDDAIIVGCIELDIPETI